MRHLYKKTALFAALICCLAGVSSCGKEIPPVDNSDLPSFSVAESEDSEEETEPDDVPPTTVSKEKEENTEAPTSAETEKNNATIVTRSKEELDKINSNKPSGGSSSGNGGSNTTTSGGGSTGGGSSTGGSGNTGSGNTGSGGGSTGSGGGSTSGSGTVSGITLSYYSCEVRVGETKKYPQVAETINEIWTTSDSSVAVVDSIGNITGKGEGTCTIRVTSADNSSLGAEVKVVVTKPDDPVDNTDAPKPAEGTDDYGVYTVDGISYKDGILLANKTYSLPSTYNPGGLTNETYSAFQTLIQGAANDGINIYLSSGFRSYDTQNWIYNDYVSRDGQAAADTYSARPGYSEHQTGLAIDVNIISDQFIGTPEAIWLEEHCYEYGFIIRYPKGKQDITGYKYEPWHIRYLGNEKAAEFKAAADAYGDPYLTLEEYLGITSYYH